MNRKISFEPKAATRWGILVAIASLIVGLIPYWMLWGENPFRLALETTGYLGLIGIFVAGIVIHELIHGLTWKLAGRLNWDAIEFGFMWQAFAPYAHAKGAMTAGAYRLGTIMPGLLTGLLPVLVGTIWALPVWAGYGAFFLSAAAGDILVYLRMLPVDRSRMVIDSPTDIGAEFVDG